MKTRKSDSQSPNTQAKNKMIKDIIQETSEKLKVKNKQKAQPSVKTKTKSKKQSPKTTRRKKHPQNESPKVIFPHITETNWNNFESRLKGDIDATTKKINACLTRMHGSEVESHFTSTHFVRRALIDALMRRNWDNFLRLVVMLAKNYSDPVFTPFIRHLCQILKHYHPAIRGTELEDQIDLVVEKHGQKRDTRINVSTSVV